LAKVSPVLDKLIKKVVIEELKLDQNPRFQAFLTDLYVNTPNHGIQAGQEINAVLMERFLVLLA